MYIRNTKDTRSSFTLLVKNTEYIHLVFSVKKTKFKKREGDESTQKITTFKKMDNFSKHQNIYVSNKQEQDVTSIRSCIIEK